MRGVAARRRSWMLGCGRGAGGACSTGVMAATVAAGCSSVSYAVVPPSVRCIPSVTCGVLTAEPFRASAPTTSKLLRSWMDAPLS